jgi:NADPH:quinone reductase-like Zn-dependent oxidoreductase
MTRRFTRQYLPLLESGHLQPIVDRIIEFKDVSEAHQRMEDNLNRGKIVLKVRN